MASGTGDLSGIAGWTADVITALGPVGVGLLTLLEVVFPPIPSEVVLPFAGYLSAIGRLHPVAAFIAATAGSVMGAALLYWLGVAFGRDRSARLFERLPFVRVEDLEKGEDWFDRHGSWAVLLGRLVPGVRSVISLPAGIEGMPLASFLTLTILGTAGWNALLMGGGYLLGRNWQELGRYSDVLNIVIAVAVVVALGRFVWRRRDRFSSDATAGTG